LRSHHSVISLSPLARAEVEQMIGELAQRHALSKEVIDSVGERTGGVPLFVEEVTRLLLERGEQGGAQAIPPTLQQSLAARLDRSAKRARSPRSARSSDAASLMRCCEPWQGSTTLLSDPGWNASATPTFFSSKAPAMRRPIASSTR
jgi:hypothetical protein